MTKQELTVGRSVVIVFIGILLLAVIVTSQGLTQEDDECSGCWLEMEDAILTASDFLKGDLYKHRDHPNEHSRSSMSRRFSHSVFKRSLDSSSAECDSCWLVLERIRTYIQASRDKDATSLGHLVKKAMLNNGWV